MTLRVSYQPQNALRLVSFGLSAVACLSELFGCLAAISLFGDPVGPVSLPGRIP